MAFPEGFPGRRRRPDHSPAETKGDPGIPAGKNPGLRRVGIYGNAKSILRKSVEDLKELKDRKLESSTSGGDRRRELLRKIQKGATFDQMWRRTPGERGGNHPVGDSSAGPGRRGTGKARQHAWKRPGCYPPSIPTSPAPDSYGGPGTPLYEEMRAGVSRYPPLSSF